MSRIHSNHVTSPAGANAVGADWLLGKTWETEVATVGDQWRFTDVENAEMQNAASGYYMMSPNIITRIVINLLIGSKRNTDYVLYVMFFRLRMGHPEYIRLGRLGSPNFWRIKSLSFGTKPLSLSKG